MEKYNRMREGPPSWETQPSQIPHRPPQGKLNGGGGLERARSRSQKTRLNKIVLPPLGGGGGPAPIGSKPMMSATVSRAGGLDSMAEESQSHGAMPMPPMAPLAPPHMPPMSGGDSHHRSGGRKHKHKHQAVASPVEGASYEGGGADAAGGAAADPEAAQEYTEVLRRYRQGTAEGDPNSQNNLAQMYELGRGVEQNFEMAARLYQLAADQGYTVAQFNLGVLHEDGRGVPKAFDTAAMLYQQAAANGDARAQLNLGCLYHRGQGVPKNDLEAARLWLLAAEQGKAEAQVFDTPCPPTKLASLLVMRVVFLLHWHTACNCAVLRARRRRPAELCRSSKMVPASC